MRQSKAEWQLTDSTNSHYANRHHAKKHHPKTHHAKRHQAKGHHAERHHAKRHQAKRHHAERYHAKGITLTVRYHAKRHHAKRHNASACIFTRNLPLSRTIIKERFSCSSEFMFRTFLYYHQCHTKNARHLSGILKNTRRSHRSERNAIVFDSIAHLLYELSQGTPPVLN